MPSSPAPYLIVGLVIAVGVVALLLLWHIWDSPLPRRGLFTWRDKRLPETGLAVYAQRDRELKLDSGRRAVDWLGVDPPTWRW